MTTPAEIMARYRELNPYDQNPAMLGWLPAKPPAGTEDLWVEAASAYLDWQTYCRGIWLAQTRDIALDQGEVEERGRLFKIAEEAAKRYRIVAGTDEPVVKPKVRSSSQKVQRGLDMGDLGSAFG